MTEDDQNGGGKWYSTSRFNKATLNSRKIINEIYIPKAVACGFRSTLPNKNKEITFDLFVKQLKKFYQKQKQLQNDNDNTDDNNKKEETKTKTKTKKKHESKNKNNNANNNNKKIKKSDTKGKSKQKTKSKSTNKGKPKRGISEAEKKNISLVDKLEQDASLVSGLSNNEKSNNISDGSSGTSNSDSDSSSDSSDDNDNKEEKTGLVPWVPVKSSSQALTMGTAIFDYQCNDGAFAETKPKCICLKTGDYNSKVNGVTGDQALEIICNGDKRFSPRNVTLMQLKPVDVDKTDRTTPWNNIEISDPMPSFGRCKKSKNPGRKDPILYYTLRIYYDLNVKQKIKSKSSQSSEKNAKNKNRSKTKCKNGSEINSDKVINNLEAQVGDIGCSNDDFAKMMGENIDDQNKNNANKNETDDSGDGSDDANGDDSGDDSGDDMIDDEHQFNIALQKEKQRRKMRLQRMRMQRDAMMYMNPYAQGWGMGNMGNMGMGMGMNSMGMGIGSMGMGMNMNNPIRMNMGCHQRKKNKRKGKRKRKMDEMFADEMDMNWLSMNNNMNIMNRNMNHHNQRSDNDNSDSDNNGSDSGNDASSESDESDDSDVPSARSKRKRKENKSKTKSKSNRKNSKKKKKKQKKKITNHKDRLKYRCNGNRLKINVNDVKMLIKKRHKKPDKKPSAFVEKGYVNNITDSRNVEIIGHRFIEYGDIISSETSGTENWCDYVKQKTLMDFTMIIKDETYKTTGPPDWEKLYPGVKSGKKNKDKDKDKVVNDNGNGSDQENNLNDNDANMDRDD